MVNVYDILGAASHRRYLWSFAVPSRNLPPSSTKFGRRIPDLCRQQRATLRENKKGTNVDVAHTISDGEQILVHAECSECTDESSQSSILPVPVNQPVDKGKNTSTIIFIMLNVMKISFRNSSQHH